MCMCDACPSWCRNDASIDVRRSRCCCGIEPPGNLAQTIGPQKGTLPAMPWDFSTEPEFQSKLDWMREFVREQIWPLETLLDDLGWDGLTRAIAPLQEQVKAQSLWAAHLGSELGGQGFGQVKLGLMHEILGTSPIAPLAFG